MAAHAKRVDAVRAERWPDIFFRAAAGNAWDISDTGSHEDTGRAGVVLALPLFKGGGIDAGIREETSRLGATRERLRKLKLQVRLEVQTARSNVRSARERVKATRKAVQQSEESLRIERLKHSLGEATITDVLDAQDDMLQSQTNYYRALADHKIAFAELNLAMGKES